MLLVRNLSPKYSRSQVPPSDLYALSFPYRTHTSVPAPFRYPTRAPAPSPTPLELHIDPARLQLLALRRLTLGCTSSRLNCGGFTQFQEYAVQPDLRFRICETEPGESSSKCTYPSLQIDRNRIFEKVRDESETDCNKQSHTLALPHILSHTHRGR